VVVIVILGILAAVAVPKFVDLKSNANAAALDGIVGNIASASAINYAARSADATKGIKTVDLTCQGAVAALLEDGLPAGYTFDNTTALVAGANTCVTTQTSSTNTKNVSILGVN